MVKFQESLQSTSDNNLTLEECDCDSSDNNDASNMCNAKFKLLDEKAISSEGTYILHMSGTMDTNFNLVIGTSNNVCEIYQFDNNRLSKTDHLEHSDVIIGVQFSPENSNMLYSASVDGSIRLWDLRLSEKVVSQFKDTTIEKPQTPKPIVCFDVSSNNRLLAAGTELHEGEAFILFWDIRNVNLLGGYWESHTDDITQLKFNPTEVNTLASGSTDGLINLYDLTQTSEEDALRDTLNTESSIEQLVWYRHKGNDCIACITHTVDVQLWKTDGVQPYVHFRRSDISKAIKRKSAAHCYIAAAHEGMNEDIFVVTGSNWNDGEYLCALRINNNNIINKYILKENKQIVRSSWYNKYHNVFVTGGEQGILDVWQASFSS